jgi:hypothetical protein
MAFSRGKPDEKNDIKKSQPGHFSISIADWVGWGWVMMSRTYKPTEISKGRRI